jgi:hypothetical protein
VRDPAPRTACAEMPECGLTVSSIRITVHSSHEENQHAEVCDRARDSRRRQHVATGLQAVSQTSCGVLQQMGPRIQWLHSYVTGDKIYCVYIARNEEMIREHALQGGFPANRISEIRSVIDPTTAEG